MKVAGELQQKMAFYYGALDTPIPDTIYMASTPSLTSLATMYERRKLSKFDGQKRNFLSFHCE